jgi:hypothetical protein
MKPTGHQDPIETARRRQDRDDAILVVALVVVGLVQMALHPRRSLQLLRGGSW